jgi:hypothetical protein
MNPLGTTVLYFEPKVEYHLLKKIASASTLLVKPSNNFFSPLEDLTQQLALQNADQKRNKLGSFMKLKYGFEFTNCRWRTIRQRRPVSCSFKGNNFIPSGNLAIIAKINYHIFSL